MPALYSDSSSNALFDRNAFMTHSLSARATNNSSDLLEVVCAWPVSGQYGPGSRVLYYVLVATCVFARKAEWLRNACLAATLLFPAVAALHSIVLAAVHVNGAVDMDVYGAFQFASIGILAAPVTVRLSRTYFYDPGRNTIFLWTSLVLAGLLSLTVEFYRIKTSHCTSDDNGKPISPRPSKFPYEDNPACGLTCSIERGPHSPLRGGSVNNIYVIPAPDKLTFGAATLLAAACCIPAILSLISMWNKILENNWKTRFGGGDDEDRIDEAIEGTNGATVRKMRDVNNRIKAFLEVVGIPLFGGAVLAILIVGERNLFSTQVRYQTEPMASIGQWAPIAGTGFAALGSLYLLLATDTEEMKRDVSPNAAPTDQAGEQRPPPHYPPDTEYLSDNGDARINDGNSPERSPQNMPPMQQISTSPPTSYPPSVTTPTTPTAAQRRHTSRNTLGPTISQASPGQSDFAGEAQTADVGNRRKVASRLTKINNFLTDAGADWSHDAEFKHGKALDFPEIPGEQQRNPDLILIREQYNPQRDAEGNVTPGLTRQRSRAGSFSSNVSVGPSFRIEGPSLAPSRRASIESQEQPTEPQSPDSQNVSKEDKPGPLPPVRRSTLEVPPRVHHRPSPSHLHSRATSDPQQGPASY